MEIELGGVYQHKATGKLCVVIRLEEDKVFVRDSDNSIQEYYKCELKPVQQSGNIF